MHYTGRHREAHEPFSWLERMRRSKMRSLLAVLAITDVSQSIFQEARFEGAPTVIESYQGNSEAMRRDPTAFCLIFHGLGLDNSEEIAEAYAPAMHDRCLVALVHYSPNGIDGREIAGRLSDFIDDHLPQKDTDDTERLVHIISNGESAGGIAQFEALQALSQLRDDVVIHAVVNDGSPTGSIDTKGPLEGFVVEAGSVIAQTPLQFSMFGKPVNYGMEIASRALRNSARDTHDPRRFNLEDIGYVVDQTDTQVYAAMLNMINQFPEADHDASFVPFGAFYYLRADDPQRDGNVDVDAAGYNWVHLVGHGETIRVPGGGHANPKQSPSYLPIMNALMQKVTNKIANDKSERARFISQVTQIALDKGRR